MVPSLACLSDNEIRRRSRSMSITLTMISSPTLATCSGISTCRSASSEMCTRPSMPSSTRTNAPKGTNLVTLPGTTWPMAWVRANCRQGSSWVAFDPTAYGMEAQYDEAGNYIYPEGFDPETQAWLPGNEAQQAAWERQYAEAQARYDAHQKQIVAAHASESEASGPREYVTEQPSAGALASDEALAALREKLAGGQV